MTKESSIKLYRFLLLCLLALFLLLFAVTHNSNLQLFLGMCRRCDSTLVDPTASLHALRDPVDQRSRLLRDLLINMLQLSGTKEILAFFHKFFTRIDMTCNRVQRLGRQDDGGYEICQEGNLKFAKDTCLVYSFGINNEWSFDEDVSKNYNCVVHSFDPSMDVSDHTHKAKIYFHNLGLWDNDTVNKEGWKMKSLSSIRSSLGHSKTLIDLIKIDVEGAEWPVLRNWIASGQLATIKQIAIEVHTPSYTRPMTVQDFADVYLLMEDLRTLGFKKYLEHHINNCYGPFHDLGKDPTNENSYACYELFYVNSKYL